MWQIVYAEQKALGSACFLHSIFLLLILLRLPCRRRFIYQLQQGHIILRRSSSFEISSSVVFQPVEKGFALNGIAELNHECIVFQYHKTWLLLTPEGGDSLKKILADEAAHAELAFPSDVLEYAISGLPKQVFDGTRVAAIPGSQIQLAEQEGMDLIL